MAGQPWMFRGNHVAQDFEGELHVLCEKGPVL